MSSPRCALCVDQRGPCNACYSLALQCAGNAAAAAGLIRAPAFHDMMVEDGNMIEQVRTLSAINARMSRALRLIAGEDQGQPPPNPPCCARGERIARLALTVCGHMRDEHERATGAVFSQRSEDLKLGIQSMTRGCLSVFFGSCLFDFHADGHVTYYSGEHVDAATFLEALAESMEMARRYFNSQLGAPPPYWRNK